MALKLYMRSRNSQLGPSCASAKGYSSDDTGLTTCDGNANQSKGTHMVLLQVEMQPVCIIVCHVRRPTQELIEDMAKTVSFVNTLGFVTLSRLANV